MGGGIKCALSKKGIEEGAFYSALTGPRVSDSKEDITYITMMLMNKEMCA